MGRDDVYPVRMSKVGCLLHYVLQVTDIGCPYWIYSYITPTHDMHQWLLLQFLVLLMMDAQSVRNMQSNLAVTNKQYCQSCILLVLCIMQTYDARKLRHKISSITLSIKIRIFKSVTILWHKRRRQLLGGPYQGLLLIIIVITYVKMKQPGFHGSTAHSGPRLLHHRCLLDHTQAHHNRQDSSVRVISPAQRPLSENTQHSQETESHAPGGIRNRYPSKRAAADPRLRRRNHRDRLLKWLTASYLSRFSHHQRLESSKRRILQNNIHKSRYSLNIVNSI